MAVDHPAATLILVERFLRGDEEALREVAGVICPILSAVLARRYRRIPVTDVEEIVNHAAWCAWRKREKYDPHRGSFDTWLYAIANRGCLDYLRRRARGFEMSVDPAVLSRLPDPHSDTIADDGGRSINCEFGEEDPAERSGCREITRVALAALPHSQRTVLTADGASPQCRADTHQLAVEFGVTKSAIRQARLRGMKRLEKELLSRGIKKVIGESRSERISNSKPIRAQNGKRKTENGKRKTENGKRKTENGKRKTENDHNRWTLTSGRGVALRGPRPGKWHAVPRFIGGATVLN